ncbi:MAG: GNAT family N-acetyltransferase [Vulcanimicrobiaceae bacterium]
MGGSIRRSSFPIGANASSIIWGERIVGTAGALVRDGYPTAIHGIRTGYIFGVRVEPAYRGNGIATRLTRACIEIRLHASDAGRPIYERLGFSPTNEMRLT